jgi:tetratricopeptide (TPR) repeat protein
MFVKSTYSNKLLFVLLQGGKAVEALADFDAALAVKPNSIDALHNRASVPIEYISLFFFKYVLSWYLLAYCQCVCVFCSHQALKVMGNASEALSGFDACLAIDPEFYLGLCGKTGITY